MAIAMLRTAIIFVAVITAVRVMGKRQLGELEPAELVVAVMISDLAANPLSELGMPIAYGLVPIITLLGFEVLISAGINRSIRFRALVCGKPSMIIENGRILQNEMKKNRFTVDELTEELRKKDILDISTVKYAILETDGTLSTLLYPNCSPATPQDLGIKVKDIGYPIILINNGRILNENLEVLGKSEKWLQNRLDERSAGSPSDVFLLTADGFGNIYCTKKEKK